MSFAILTDTSANLPTPLLEKHGITVVPFSYSYDGAEHFCLDTETFDGAAYYGAMRKGTVVTTSLVNPGRFIAAARPLLAAGKDILFVGMSSGISGSFVMLLLGFYGTIIGAVADLNFLVLIPFAIGCLIGLITVTKLIKWLLARYAEPSYSAILGFVFGSILCIFPGWSAMLAFWPILMVVVGIAAITLCNRISG